MADPALSDIALRKDLAANDGDTESREESGGPDTAEVFLFKDRGELVTFNTVFGWSYVECALESPELNDNLSMLFV